jgi:hypothetical protein
VDELESELKKAKAQSDVFFEDGIRKAKRIDTLTKIVLGMRHAPFTCPQNKFTPYYWLTEDEWESVFEDKE